MKVGKFTGCNFLMKTCHSLEAKIRNELKKVAGVDFEAILRIKKPCLVVWSQERPKIEYGSYCTLKKLCHFSSR